MVAVGAASLLCVRAVTCDCGAWVDSAAALALSTAGGTVGTSAVVDVGSVTAALTCGGASLPAGTMSDKGSTVAVASGCWMAEVLAGGTGGSCSLFEAPDGAVAELASSTDDGASCAPADEGSVTLLAFGSAAVFCGAPMDTMAIDGSVADAEFVSLFVEAAGTESLGASVDTWSAVDGPCTIELLPETFAEVVSGPLLADCAVTVLSTPGPASMTGASRAGWVDGAATCSKTAATGSAVASVETADSLVALVASVADFDVGCGADSASTGATDVG